MWALTKLVFSETLYLQFYQLISSFYTARICLISRGSLEFPCFSMFFGSTMVKIHPHLWQDRRAGLNWPIILLTKTGRLQELVHLVLFLSILQRNITTDWSLLYKAGWKITIRCWENMQLACSMYTKSWLLSRAALAAKSLFVGPSDFSLSSRLGDGQRAASK